MKDQPTDGSLLQHIGAYPWSLQLSGASSGVMFLPVFEILAHNFNPIFTAPSGILRDKHTLKGDLRADLDSFQNRHNLTQSLHHILGGLLQGLAALFELPGRAHVSTDRSRRGRARVRV